MLGERGGEECGCRRTWKGRCRQEEHGLDIDSGWSALSVGGMTLTLRCFEVVVANGLWYQYMYIHVSIHAEADLYNEIPTFITDNSDQISSPQVGMCAKSRLVPAQHRRCIVHLRLRLASTVFSKGIGIPMASVRPGSTQLTTVTPMNTLECSRAWETFLRVRYINLDGRRCTPTRTLCCTVNRGSYMYDLRYEPDNSRRLSTYVHVHVLRLEGLLDS
jgi:hypothetical protein